MRDLGLAMRARKELEVLAQGTEHEAFGVDAKAGGELDVTDRHDARSRIDNPLELVEIDSALALFAHTHLDAECLAKAQPRIEVRRKLATKGHDIVARSPCQSVGHRR